MILHKSKYVEISYEQENSLIVQRFLLESEKMTKDEFKNEMNKFVEMCEKHKPERELANLLDMKYVIVPDVQEWMNTEIFPRYENIIKRMAFLVPSELFPSVSVEQTMNEEVGQKFTQKYFDNEKDARNWLFE
ncbi:MAG: hypothetical protein B6I20_08090 [Bacteroidetes bacterium 4572_117]|nr:MAG: hypothetical protein B6I20_08090 [Bacteroidetes bacterium 4572_117]